METVFGIEKISPDHQKAVLVLGFFDGVHLGHQALIQRAKILAENDSPKKKVLLYTFNRHPLEIVDPPHAPFLLTTMEEKIKLISRLPVDALLIGEFDQKLSLFSPDTFLRRIVLDKLQPAAVTVGFNYRYGKGHQGNVNTLLQDASNLGFPVTVVEPCILDGEVVSSTRIRKLLLEGNEKKAQPLLGRNYSLEGMVISGEGRGKSLGFPTANLQINSRKLIPRPGIYAGIAELNGKRYGGMISIGDKPTFHGSAFAVEIHLFDFKETIYGKTIHVEFLAWRREQEKFSSPEALTEKMKEDAAWGLDFLRRHAQNPS